MRVNDITIAPDSALPVEQFKAHLRLGTGFGDDSLQDGLLIEYLRAALAAIEARTGRIALERRVEIVFQSWQTETRQTLPVLPVQSIDAVLVTDAAGFETVLGSQSLRLEQSMHRTALLPVGATLPPIPVGGEMRLELTVGLAADWGGLPADLCQAVLMLAAHYYEYRHEATLADGCMPLGVSALLQRYRVTRLTLGAVS